MFCYGLMIPVLFIKSKAVVIAINKAFTPIFVPLIPKDVVAVKVSFKYYLINSYVAAARQSANYCYKMCFLTDFSLYSCF